MHKCGILTLLFVLVTLTGNSQSKDLNYYLDQAVRNSPLLNEYKNQVSSAGYDSMLVRSSQKPQVEFNTSLQYFPYNDKIGYDEVITDGGNYSVLAGVSQNIFNRRETENRLRAATLIRNSAFNSSKVSELELAKIVTSQYLTAFSAQTDLNFNNSFLDLFRKELEITSALVKSGSAKETDYLSLLNETHAQEILVMQLENQFRKDVFLLNQLCGLSNPENFELVIPVLQVIGYADVNNDPSFQKFVIDSIRLQNEKEAIDLRYRPRMKWFADAGLLTSTPMNFYRHFGASAGVSLNVPIYDGNQRSIEKNKLQLEENSRQFYMNSYRNQYNLQVSQLQDELKMLNEIEVSVNEQVRIAGVLAGALKSQLESGIVLMTEYINAIRSQRTAGRDLNMIHISKMQVINEINYFFKH